MTYEQAIDYIHSFRRFGKKAGLTKIARLLELLGSPHKRLRFVHVAGTNGKGSIVSMLSSVLCAAGYKTGLFISPFVVDFTERMQINGTYISQGELARVTALVRAQAQRVARELDAPSEFEVVTAIALYWFCEQGCDIVCLEVGLGGRLDPTNVIDTPDAAVIANIGLDHTSILGHTTERIAFEKAGIIKPGGTAVAYPGLAPDVMAVLYERAAQQNARVVQGSRAAARVLRDEAFASVVEYGGLTYTLPLAGAHQICNLICVAETARVLREQGFAIGDAALTDGVARTRIPARMERFAGAPAVVIDGAHNPQGAAVAAAVAARVPGRRVLLYGALAEKDWKNALAALAPVFDEMVAVQMNVNGALQTGVISEQANKQSIACTPCADAAQALAIAKERAGRHGTVFVCGSLYLASEVRPLLITPPRV